MIIADLTAAPSLTESTTIIEDNITEKVVCSDFKILNRKQKTPS